ncbi:MAG: PDZ domain-containing protein [Bacteroidales bacterium]
MKYKYTLVLLISILALVSCTEKKEDQIPKGAFPIIVYHGHIYIKGEVDSAKGNFVFDTGSPNLYFDNTYYANNGFKYDNIFNAMLPGVGLTAQKVVVIKDSIDFKFGTDLYKTSYVPVIQLKPILGDIADGMLGLEYFNNSILEINYEKDYMKIIPSIDSIDIQGYTKIALIKKPGRLYIPLQININDTINISGNYLLDFGAGGSVHLTSSIAKKYNLKDNIENKAAFFGKYMGVGGESSCYDFIACRLKIGGFSFHNVVMSFSEDKQGFYASGNNPGILGNIGTDIYERFNIVMDFINNDLYLKPNNKYNDLFEIPQLGFSYVDRVKTLKSWIVTGLYASSSAEKSGLKIDDKIIAVNGVKVSDINYKQQATFFKKIDKVHLKIERNGKLIQINFRLEPLLKTANNIETANNEYAK